MGGIVDAVFGGNDPPNPYEVANAQSGINESTARTTAKLNRADQVTPYGNLTWQDLGNDRWQSTITLSPEQQALLDQQTKINLGLGKAQTSALNRVQDTFRTGINTHSLPSRLSPTSALRSSTSSMYDPEKLYSSAEDLAGTTKGYLQQTLQDYANPVSHVSPTAAPYSPTVSAGGRVAFEKPFGDMPVSDENYRKQIQDALYGQFTSRLDPRFQQREGDLESRLAVQGITQGSQAYDREYGNLWRERNDAYAQAMRDAVTQGEAAVAGQFGRDMSGRQQAASEERDRVTAALQGRGQDLQASIAQANADQAQQAMQFGQAMSDANFGLAQKQFSLSKLAQALQAATTGNEGVGRAAELGLRTSSAIPETAANYAKLYGDERTAGINEQTALRNQVLNELNTIRSGAQAQTPQFQSGQTGAQVAGTDLSGNVYKSYNAEEAKQSALNGDIAKLGMMALSYFF